MHPSAVVSLAVALCVVALASSVSAQQGAVVPSVPYKPRTVPVVIHDAGGTPIGQFTESVTEEGATNTAAPALVIPSSVPVFPVVSTKMGPGRLAAPTRGKVKGGPGQPICVLGDDPLSLQWLRLNQAVLLRMQAGCLVASVRDEASWRNLQATAAGIRLAPGSADALATAMGISVYPILVAPDGLVSQ